MPWVQAWNGRKINSFSWKKTKNEEIDTHPAGSTTNKEEKRPLFLRLESPILSKSQQTYKEIYEETPARACGEKETKPTKTKKKKSLNK